ncbi:MAG: glutamate racemase, partial [Myxococcota bacterium]
MTAPIGIFDSGVGGLTVARRVADRLPAESLLYLGDTARVPYGNKSSETVQRYSINVTRHLRRLGAKALVIACNTASAHALELLADTYAPVPVIGVIAPVAQQAARTTQTGAVGVIGTRGTISSGAYTRALHRHDPQIEVHALPCPLFVPLAEEGWTEGSIPTEVARTYLAPLAHTPIDTLILGCTHYPLLAPIIRQVVHELTGREVHVLDSAAATSDMLADTLDDLGLCATP